MIYTMLAASLALSSAYTAPMSVSRSAVSRAGPIQAKVGLIYSTTTGNTETVAGYIAEEIGAEAVDIADCSTDDLMAYDGLICGAPTWHTGADTERSGTAWDEFL